MILIFHFFHFFQGVGCLKSFMGFDKLFITGFLRLFYIYLNKERSYY